MRLALRLSPMMTYLQMKMKNWTKRNRSSILSRFHPMKRYLLDLILSLFTFKREKEFLMLRSLIPEVMLYCLVQVISKEITWNLFAPEICLSRSFLIFYPWMLSLLLKRFFILTWTLIKTCCWTIIFTTAWSKRLSRKKHWFIVTFFRCYFIFVNILGSITITDCFW